jgi:tocopherol cyclase
MINLRFFRPDVFQGNLKRDRYFEGWYFKHVSKDLSGVYSFIPGVSVNSTDPHAFIQVINGITGESEYISYRLKDFQWDNKRLYLRIGDSVFTKEYIDLNINHPDLTVRGRIDYTNRVQYPSSMLSPGIMGWYSFVPFMECKHGIVSVNHDLSGSLIINGNTINLSGGTGYIEKDWGSSFPEAWIWVQSNNFSRKTTSFTFSLGKIPWIGRFFIGFIAFLYLDGKFYLFSTYNKSVLEKINHSKSTVSFILKNPRNTLEVLVRKNTFTELVAPVKGNMSRRIKESIDSEVDISLYDNKKNLIYSDSGKRAGLEVIEEIFGYI